MGINAFVALTISKNGEKPEQALAAALVAGVILVIEVRSYPPAHLIHFQTCFLNGCANPFVQSVDSYGWLFFITESLLCQFTVAR